ncbi:FUSC family protein [Streptomyces pacificus]|uniref:FUSC family protein n=1 Tax=Streptomyces pacificus TaxID=2705029 RepID=A0A6A0AYZ9_9ACTN|nr:FUSC family protein [Streptomyces pacificus]GFH37551.1 FUSC family protein [Streptomyces pacificus]
MKSGAERTEILHRSLRVSLAASAGFYPFLYWLDEPVLALYALFAPIALGLLSSIPGSGRQRAVVMLRALPVGLLLVALGTLLAVQTWAAALGMLVVGFLLSFAAVAGPRPAGAGPGLQLFYILACFPPYQPETLWLRLAGLVFGVLVLALCELLLLPQSAGPNYRTALAGAVATAGDTLAGRIRLSPEDLRAAGARLRLSQFPPAERPAGPGRAVRGLSHAGGAARRLLEQLAHLTESGELRPLVPGNPAGGGGSGGSGTRSRSGDRPENGGAGGGNSSASSTGSGSGDGTVSGGGAPEGADAASRSLLPQMASLCEETGAALRAGRPSSGPDRMDEAIHDFQQTRVRQVTGPPADVPPVQVLHRQAAVLAVAESVRILEISVRVGLDGRRTPPIEPRELFWYAHTPAPQLWIRRFTGNMTLHSVQFQNAVRIALALAAARLVAGSLGLNHGFWVLLAVLTLSRTTFGQTWAAIRRAVAGNLVGAVAAGGLLIGLGQHTDVYAALLAPGMLLAFALGPLLGIAWAQGLFTLVVAIAFAQIAPATWQLAEARIVDVVTGSAIGLLCALLAWPAGARREVRRTMAELLHACGPLVRGTVAVLTAMPPGSGTPPPTQPALHRLRLAEAAYDQFRSEPAGSGTARADWHAVLIAARQVLLGAHWLPRFDLPAAALPADAADRARAGARAVADTTVRLACLCAGDRPPDRAATGAATRSAPCSPAGPPLPALVDLEVWLRGLDAQLARIEAGLPETAGRHRA